MHDLYSIACLRVSSFLSVQRCIHEHVAGDSLSVICVQTGVTSHVFHGGRQEINCKFFILVDSHLAVIWVPFLRTPVTCHFTNY